MLFNATEAEESRVAILADGLFDEYYMERASLGSCVGNIYKAKITNIEPSIDAAFLEFGGQRHGFLHASDVMRGLKEEKKAKKTKKKKKATEEEASAEQGNPQEKPKKKKKKRGQYAIHELLSMGQDLIVQVSKDGINDKAPTLTTFISIPGRFLVFMPGSTKMGISRKIEDENERNRLKKLLSELDKPEDMGIIVRTAGVHQTKKALQKDIRYLNKLWQVIKKRTRSKSSPSALYQENDLAIRALRDLYSSDIKEILVDSEDVYKRLKDFMRVIMPRHVDRVKLYKKKQPLFDHYNLEKELEHIFNRRIALKSGGSLIIEQTEAMVSIDVNSGKFKADELEETAYMINLDAAEEIARQLRLRDLGGLIVNDFIDMKQEKHRREVEKKFREALKVDRARIKVAKMSIFGLIEMTRQRVRPSLKRSVYDKCSTCSGTGYVASIETTCLNIIRKIRLWVTQKRRVLKIEVNPKIADYLNNYKRRLLLQLEDEYGKQIEVIGSASIPMGELKVVNKNNGQDTTIHTPSGH